MREGAQAGPGGVAVEKHELEVDAFVVSGGVQVHCGVLGTLIEVDLHVPAEAFGLEDFADLQPPTGPEV